MRIYGPIREKPPCKGCDERHVGCHDRCERYAEWRAKANKANEERRKYNLVTQIR